MPLLPKALVMKSARFVGGIVLFGAALLPAAAWSETPKTGLWKITMQGASTEHENFDCVTDEEVAKFESGGWDSFEPPYENCQTTDRKQRSDGFSVEYLCDSEHQKGTGSMSMTLSDSEHWTMTMNFKGSLSMQPDAKPMPIDVDMKVDAAWSGPDCGKYADQDE